MLEPSSSSFRSPGVIASRGFAAPASDRHLSIEFTGNAQEYFGIWIVNVLLSIVTLGIYSAWAKVRSKNYFYRHTRLDGASFEYHGDPIKILKGRLIVGALLASVSLSNLLSPVLYLLALCVLVGLTPLFVVLSANFNARNSSYRNVRFGFHGTIGESYRAFFIGAMAYMLTLGLGFPYFQWRYTSFLMSSYSFGKTRFAWHGEVREFFKAYFVAFLIGMCGLVGMVVAMFMFVGAAGGAQQAKNIQQGIFVGMPFFYAAIFVASAYLAARLGNAVLNSLHIGLHSFRSTQRPRDVIWIYFSNAVAIICSAGLLGAWAKVRLVRYRLAHLELVCAGELLEQSDAQGRERGVFGDAAADLGGLDVDLGL